MGIHLVLSGGAKKRRMREAHQIPLLLKVQPKILPVNDLPFHIIGLVRVFFSQSSLTSRRSFRSGPTLLDRFAAMLSYNSLVDVRPRASSLQGWAAEGERSDRPHRVFVHRTSNEAAFDCNVLAIRPAVSAPESRSQRH